MKRIVVKFGGSILKSRTEVDRLISVVRMYKLPIIIVVSALYGITDSIITALDDIKKEEAAIGNLLKYLEDRHVELVQLLIDEEKTRDEAINEIRARLTVLGKYLTGVHCLGEIPDFAFDLALSYGERMASLLFSSLLNHHKIKCREALPEEIGLITDGEFRNASVDFEVSEKPVKKALQEKTIYVVPGFYGLSPDSKINLLGRGGSDYSAAAIARCVNAISVDIWKDVPGFMSADPKLVPDARCLKNLNYKEAAELSYFGARILHPSTFDPVRGKNIPIRLFNINNEVLSLDPLTAITDKSIISRDVIKSVTFSDDIGILKLRGGGVGIKPGIIAKTASSLNNARINIKSIITTQTTINILLAKEDLEKSYRIVRDIGLSYVDDIVTVDDISLVAVVGEGMLESSGIAARIFTAVSMEGINVSIISAGASSVAVYFIVDREDREKAVQAIHGEFFK